MQKIKIMINGLPGNVAALVARFAIADETFDIIPFSLTGPEIDAPDCTVGSTVFSLLTPDKREQVVGGIVEEHGPFITIDYTHPSAVVANAGFYCRHNLPFVMGTTGGDRQKLVETVQQSRISAVIAPNMAKQIVGFQAMMEYAATAFPGLFSGYGLEVEESHQAGKADTSGTAKAMVAYFNQLGIPFDANDIVKVRDPEIQERDWGIPPAYLSGHGWHTYTLTSADGTVRFQFKHNINGRDVYVGGTLDAVRFLDRQINGGSSGRVFSMIDVLKGGR